MKKALSFLSCVIVTAALLSQMSCGPALSNVTNDAGEKLAAKLTGLWFLTNDVITTNSTTTTNYYTETGVEKYYIEFYSDKTCLAIMISNDVTNTNLYSFSVDNSSNLALSYNMPDMTITNTNLFVFIYKLTSMRTSTSQHISSADSGELYFQGIQQLNVSFNIELTWYGDIYFTNIIYTQTMSSNSVTNLNESASDYAKYLKK